MPTDRVEKQRTAIVIALSLGAGLLIGYVDSRPTWDDTGMTAGALLLSGLILAAVRPRVAWVVGLAVGMPGVAFSYLLNRNPGSIIALAFSMVGAGMGYAMGAALRRGGQSRISS